MYIAIVPNRSSPPAVLLREGYREGGKAKNRTLANLSSLSMDQVEALRAVLRGEKLVPAADLFEVSSSRHHGHVEAVRVAMRRLGLEQVLASRPSRERDLVCAMIAARIVAPHTKLATTRWWQSTTLPADLGVAEATEDDLYEAMDWLLDHQAGIEKKLAARHLKEGGLVFYDLSSSYFEGTSCPLARLGYNRDRKRGKLQVNYGLVTAPGGCPVAVSVFDENTGDSSTLPTQINKLKGAFKIEKLVLVGDRGMISQKAIDQDLKALAGLAWITALKSGQIRSLIEAGSIQMGLFDERNLFELTHPDFPGQRLIACRNVELQKLREHKRRSLIAATAAELERVRDMVERGSLRGSDKIGVRVGKVINKYKVQKHFALDIGEQSFAFHPLIDAIAAEAALDGVYVIRTSLSATEMSADQTVRSYKALADVERAFLSLKTIELKVRPIHHRLEGRVRSHIFLCMLAYYVEWHMREAWRPLMFTDQDQQAKQTRDPVAPAKRSAAALAKVAARTLDDGTPVHCFRTLLTELGTIVRNTCHAPGTAPNGPTFEVVTTANPTQARALELLKTIAV